MAQSQSVQLQQPWALLHHSEEPRRPLDRQSEAERAAAARRIEARLTRNRDRALAEFALCSRPYF
jgi:hypothetical protein